MAVERAVTEHAKGLWSWTARHPEWHPGNWGAEVTSFAARGERGVLLLLDPQLPEVGDGREEVLAHLDRQAALKSTSGISIQVSVGYHARSTEQLWDRYRGGDARVSVHGHKAVLKRLRPRVKKDFHEIEVGADLPGGVVPFAIGHPRRQETPLWIRKHAAMLFGDAVVTTPEGKVRSWAHDPVDSKVRSFYLERFNPTLEPMLDLGLERLLMTHGESVMGGAPRALRDCIASDPWHHGG